MSRRSAPAVALTAALLAAVVAGASALRTQRPVAEHDGTGMVVTSGEREWTLRAAAVCGQAPPGSGGSTLPCRAEVRPPGRTIRPAGRVLRLRFDAPVERVHWSAQRFRDGVALQVMHPGRAQATADPHVWTLDLDHQMARPHGRAGRPNAIQIVADYRDTVMRGGAPVAEATSAYELGIRR